MNIIWKKTYETGIKEIDEQHKYFVDIINKLYVSISKKTNNEEIDFIISELKTYANFHFMSEELLFKKHKYIGENYESHIKKHAEFHKLINKYESGENDSKETVAFILADFLRKWLINHILVADMKFAKFVNQTQ